MKHLLYNNTETCEKIAKVLIITILTYIFGNILIATTNLYVNIVT